MMNQTFADIDCPIPGRAEPPDWRGEVIHCPLPLAIRNEKIDSLNSDVCEVLVSAGCPLALPVQDRLDFETLLVGLSTSFIGQPASQVDSQIDAALRRLVEYLGMDRGSLAELQPDQKQLVITHSYHTPGTPPNPRMILDEQLPWYTRTIHNGQPLRLSVIPDDLPPEAIHERAYCLREGMKSHVMIPLSVMGTVSGALGFASFRRHRDWPDELIQRLRLVGEIFTNALARKRADEALNTRELLLRQSRANLRNLAAKLLHAQEEERRRVAREMHDDWTQRLALLAINLANAKTQIATPEITLPLLNAIQEQLVELSEDVHDLSRQLHPSILNDLGLVEALRSECSSFSRREGIDVDYQPGRMPFVLEKDVALCVYRIAQETLRNVAKHASVTEASVMLSTTGSALLMRIQDRGIGFDCDRMRTDPGLGISSIKERVRLIQGQLAITSAPGCGTTVEVRVPLMRSDS